MNFLNREKINFRKKFVEFLIKYVVNRKDIRFYYPTSKYIPGTELHCDTSISAHPGHLVSRNQSHSISVTFYVAVEQQSTLEPILALIYINGINSSNMVFHWNGVTVV